MKKRIIIPVATIAVIILCIFSIKIFNKGKIENVQAESAAENINSNKDNAIKGKEDNNTNKVDENKSSNKDTNKSKDSTVEAKKEEVKEVKEDNKAKEESIESTVNKVAEKEKDIKGKENKSENKTEYVTVPNILKQSNNSVYVKLRNTPGIVVDENPKYVESKLPPNTVISQDPAPGTRVPYGTKLTFVCSKESNLNENNPYYNDVLPDVVGMKQGAGMYKLNKMGFGMITEVIEGPKSLTGKIAKTVPSAGTKMKANQWVTLYIYNELTE